MNHSTILSLRVKQLHLSKGSISWEHCLVKTRCHYFHENTFCLVIISSQVVENMHQCQRTHDWLCILIIFDMQINLQQIWLCEISENHKHINNSRQHTSIHTLNTRLKQHHIIYTFQHKYKVTSMLNTVWIRSKADRHRMTLNFDVPHGAISVKTT